MGDLTQNAIVYVLALTALIDTVLGLVVITRAFRQSYAWYFLGIVASAVLWMYGDVLILYGHTPSAIGVGEVLFYVSPLFTPMFMWFFALTFPSNKKIPRKAVIFGVTYALVWSAMIALNMSNFSEVVVGIPANTVLPVFPGFLFDGLYLLSFFGLAFITLISKLIRGRGIARSQLAYTFYGLMLSAVLAMASNVALPMMGVRDWIWLGPVFTLSGVSAITFAIIRYHLFDIRLFVIRALAYIVVVFAMTLLFVVPFILFLNHIYNTDLSAGQITFGVVLSVAFLYVAFYFRHLFDRLTNRVFFRGSLDPQYVLGRINNVLVHTADLQGLREQTAEILSDTLHPESLRYILFNEGGAEVEKLAWQLELYCTKYDRAIVDADLLGAEDSETADAMRRADVTLAIRLRPIHGDLGFMVLGPRRSGGVYSEQDKKLLSIVAEGIAISLQNALRFQEIQHFNITLQEEVDNATSRLKKSNQKLQELDETKDDFISMASHQLRTPLTSVKGYLSMVVDGDVGTLNPKQKKMLEQAFISSQRMAYLITDLLNISRLKTGKFVIDARPTNLNQMVEQEIIQLQPAARSKGLTLTFDKPAAFPALLMLDENKTRQVVMNFIDNAIYYTPAGGHIKVELHERPSSVELLVIDDGIGVPKSEQHRLFSKFYRATNARQTRPDGTGLGLFMAKKVIVAQGGSIIFSSKPGHGSTFGFAFPKAALRVNDQPSDSKRKVAAGPAAASGAKKQPARSR